jgi:hypothetical protein
MVCELFGLKTTRMVFTGMASKPVATVSGGLTSKPVATVFAILATKPVVTVFAGLASKPVATVFIGLASKPVATVFSSLASKLVVTVSPGLASKLRWWRVFRFGPQNRYLWFGDLGLKITVMVSWFVPQNQVGFSLSVAPQNRRREVGVGHASRSSDLLHVEASLARISQSGLKTGRGVTIGGARGTITEVASEAS